MARVAPDGVVGEARPQEFARAMAGCPGLGARAKASGQAMRALSELVDSLPVAASLYFDAGPRRAVVRQGFRVCTVPLYRVREAARSAATIASAFRALEPSPRAFVMSAASLLSVGHGKEAEETACEGLRRFGVGSDGGSLALTAAMVARRRGDWAAAKRHYLSMHDCCLDSDRRVAYAAGSLSAVESSDLEAARHFYVALMALGTDTGHKMLRDIAAIRIGRGDGPGVQAALNCLQRFSPIKPRKEHA